MSALILTRETLKAICREEFRWLNNLFIFWTRNRQNSKMNSWLLNRILKKWLFDIYCLTSYFNLLIYSFDLGSDAFEVELIPCLRNRSEHADRKLGATDVKSIHILFFTELFERFFISKLRLDIEIRYYL